MITQRNFCTFELAIYSFETVEPTQSAVLCRSQTVADIGTSHHDLDELLNRFNHQCCAVDQWSPNNPSLSFNSYRTCITQLRDIGTGLERKKETTADTEGDILTQRS